MSCEATMSELVELPAWRFVEVRHLAECEACRDVAAAIEHGQQVLVDDVEAFVEGGDFDAAFAAALHPPEPVAQAPRFTGLHGFVVALAAAAVLVVAGAETPVLQPFLPDWSTPGLSDEEQDALEGVDEISGMDDGDRTRQEWHDEAYLLANDAMRFASEDPASFELWVAVLRAAELGEVPQLVELAVERASFLGVLDPGLLWLVEDPEVRERLTVPPIAVAVVGEHRLVEAGGTVVRGENRLVDLDLRAVPVSIGGTACGTFRPEARLVVRALEGTVAVDDLAPERCVPSEVPAGPDPVQPPRTAVPRETPVRVQAPVETPAVVAPAPVEPAIEAEPVESERGEGSYQVTERVPHPQCDILELEIRARVGRLTADEITCLEDRLRAADRQTLASKLSLVLLANAMAVGDRDRWMELAGQHLEDYGFDADLAFAYAKGLYERGQYRQAAHWADAALEERSYWSGFTHVSRVDACYRIKVYSLQQLWLRAVDATSWDPLPSSKADARRLRLEVKTAAREWYQYAESAGIDGEQALSICAAAAGSEDPCE